jgi:predicted nucleic acid-binding Zn ribbon protein
VSSDPRAPSTQPTPRTPPDQVARAALARAQEGARARGLRPGQPVGKGRARTDGTPGTPGAGPGDPQPLGLTAARLVAERGWTPGLVAGDLTNRWAELVGPQVAEHASVEHLEGGLLTLRASSTAWATNLTLLAPQLLRALADGLGEGVVVEVKVLPPAGPGFGRGRRSVPGRGPRDTWG